MKGVLFIFCVLIMHDCIIGQSNERKLLFIGIDGCRWDALQAANTPAIDGLLTTAKYSGDGLTEYKTWSGTGWSNMLSGVWHTKHNVSDNTFQNPNFDEYPDFLSRLEANDPSLNTVSVVHWAPINTTIIQNIDHKVTLTTDAGVKDSAIHYLAMNDTDVLFVDFDDVDHTGHAEGFGPGFPNYMASIETTDSYIGEILSALYARPNYNQEDWLVIVTTDHGGNASGHGGGTLEERRIFHVFSNPAFEQQQWSATTNVSTAVGPVITFGNGALATPASSSNFEFGADQDFTVEMWVKASVFDGDPALVGNKDWNSGANPGFVIAGQNDWYWKVNIGDGQDRLDVQGGELEPETWHHLAVSFDRDGLMTAYEDGVVVGFEWMNEIDNINTGLPLCIHQDGTGTYGYSFNGSLRDIRIWNSVIPEDVIRLYAAEEVDASHPFYANLLAQWICNEGEGNQLWDSGPFANHASITGVSSWNLDEVLNREIYDYSLTPRQPDNAVTAMQWMCLEEDPAWNLDGRPWLEMCLVDQTVEQKQPAAWLWPNPVSEVLNIEFPSSMGMEDQIQIRDTHGKILYSAKKGSALQKLDVSHWPQATYCLLYTTNGKLCNFRFVVVHQ